MLVALAGCFAEPDLEITAVRSDLSFNIHIDVCRAEQCEGNFAFPKNTTHTQYSVFVFIDEGISRVMLKLDRDAYSGCIDIKLLGETLERTIVLGTEVEPVWSCPAGVSCETLKNCP